MYATDNTTFINGIGVTFALLMGIFMLVLPRRQALLPLVAMVCYMTMGQRVLILDLNFTLLRVLMLFGFARVVLRREVQIGTFGRLDRVLIWWVLSSVLTYTLLWRTGGAFVNRLGLAYDALGLYFLFRVLVKDFDDIQMVVRQFAWLTIPLAAIVLIEKQTGFNAFAVLGGVPTETLVREGVLRSQGPFMHPILAGAFASALLPLFLGLWLLGNHRLVALSGVLSAVVITWAAGSSGPLLAAIAGMASLGMWPLRKHMRMVRWTFGLTIVALQLAMQAPVWFLVGRVAVFGGSTGYHRAILIDRAIFHVGDWWLIGTHSTSNWGYYMFDITNQYVLIAVQGGLITLVLFVALIATGFSAVGHAVARWEKVDRKKQWVAWSLGASLVVHAVNFVSVPYFDQNIVCWYLLLAALATLKRSANVTLPLADINSNDSESTARRSVERPVPHLSHASRAHSGATA